MIGANLAAALVLTAWATGFLFGMLFVLLLWNGR